MFADRKLILVLTQATAIMGIGFFHTTLVKTYRRLFECLMFYN